MQRPAPVEEKDGENVERRTRWLYSNSVVNKAAILCKQPYYYAIACRSSDATTKLLYLSACVVVCLLCVKALDSFFVFSSSTFCRLYLYFGVCTLKNISSLINCLRVSGPVYQTLFEEN